MDSNELNREINNETSESTVETSTNGEMVNEAKPMTDEEIAASAEKLNTNPYAAYSTGYNNTANNQGYTNAYGNGSQNYNNGYQGYNNAYNNNAYNNSAYNNNAYNNNAYNNNGYYNYNTNPNYNTTWQTAVQEPKKKGGAAKFFKFVGIAACFGVISSACFFGVKKGLDHFFPTVQPVVQVPTTGDTEASGIKTVNISNLSDALDHTDNSAPVVVAENNMPCTVVISGVYKTTGSYWGMPVEYESEGGGTGFIVGKNETELLIATNNHVVENTTKLTVTFVDGTTLDATVRANDSKNDLAVVSIPLESISSDTMSAIKVAVLGSSDDTKIGEMVIAIGNALGYGQSVTVGYISAKDREITVEGNKLTLLQTDAAINNGNSGGPLFNVKGEVIGINSAKLSDESVEGMCYAIPISSALPILEELMTREIVAEEEQGYLGISIKTVSPDIAQIYGWPQGVYVYSVVAGGSAEAAEIYEGDFITAINGVSVTTSDELKAAVNSYRYGTTITVSLKRQENGKWVDYTKSVILMKRPE